VGVAGVSSGLIARMAACSGLAGCKSNVLEPA
jgi:hypothetical protein